MPFLSNFELILPHCVGYSQCQDAVRLMLGDPDPARGTKKIIFFPNLHQHGNTTCRLDLNPYNFGSVSGSGLKIMDC